MHLGKEIMENNTKETLKYNMYIYIHTSNLSNYLQHISVHELIYLGAFHEATYNSLYYLVPTK